MRIENFIYLEFPNSYCGTDINPGTKMTSKGGTLIILVSADDEMEGKGLRAHVRFV